MLRLQTIIKICLLASLSFAGGVRADELTDQAKALMDKGGWQAAYELLAPQESTRAGDVDFDLLLGTAALETGKITNAVFALERVLAMQPNNHQARAEIARAYFALGEVRTARKEFEFVNEQSLPDEAKINVGKYLAAIEQVESAGKTVLKGFAELTVGYDTNVNAGPAGSQVAVPLFGGALFTLNSSSLASRDGFTNFTAGLSLRSPLTKGVDLFANLTGNQRINGTYNIFDAGGADGSIGLSYKQERDSFSMGYQLNSFYLNNNRYRDISGLTAQWQRDFNARNQASLFVQYGSIRYPGQPLRDADRTVVGINAAHALPDRKTIFYGGLYGGNEKEIHAGVPQVGNSLWGARIGGQHQYRDNLTVFANFGYENRSYGGRDPFFLTVRNDDQATLGVGVVWSVIQQWRVTSQYTHMRNSSNTPINTYKRDLLSVSARYSF